MNELLVHPLFMIGTQSVLAIFAFNSLFRADYSQAAGLFGAMFLTVSFTMLISDKWLPRSPGYCFFYLLACVLLAASAHLAGAEFFPLFYWKRFSVFVL
jgi:hypothetical protein